MIIAGVDIGTLTSRLLIADVPESGPYRELESDRRIVRLGEGLHAEGALLPQAMERVINTLGEWRQLIERSHVDREVAVATQAVRKATNRDEFLANIKRKSGFEVEVISGEEEARRTMLGIRSGLPSGTGGVVGLDIGGGSTELMLDRPGEPLMVRSVELGVVRLTERLLADDPPTLAEVNVAEEEIRNQAERVHGTLGTLAGLTLVGTAGTITTLAAMAQRLPTYEAIRIHNYWLTLDSIRGLEQELLARKVSQRRGMPGLEPGREDVIVAGTLILRCIMQTLGFTAALVSDLGLREGIVLDLAARLSR